MGPDPGKTQLNYFFSEVNKIELHGVNIRNEITHLCFASDYLFLFYFALWHVSLIEICFIVDPYLDRIF
jgi:hypothetical protein